MNLNALVRRGVTGVVISSALLAGCGQSTSSAPDKQSGQKAATSATTPLKVSFAYVGPVSDGGWTQSHEMARRALEKQFGNRIQTSFMPNIDNSDSASKAFAQMVKEGNGLVFGTSFVHMDAIVSAAGQTPQVKFTHATGYKTADNLSTYDSRIYEGAYLAGVVAGAMSKSQTLGVVASVPIAEVRRNINSFTLGAQSVNPAIQTKVVWVGEWFNPARETEAATALIDQGADILLQNTDSSAVLQTAEARGKRGFGWNSNMAGYGPQAHIGSVVIDWLPYYSKSVNDALTGKWTSTTTWWGVKEGVIDLVELAKDIPESVHGRLQEVKSGLKNGSFTIWKGPVRDQSGKEVIAAGKIVDDDFLKNMDFLVQGVHEVVVQFRK